MKREISIIIATLLFLNFACSKIKQRNSEENLESKIKSCRISTYRVKIESGKLVKGEFFKCDSEYYDISNKLIKLRPLQTGVPQL